MNYQLLKEEEIILEALEDNKVCPKCTHSLIKYTQIDYYCPICEKEWNTTELIKAIRKKLEDTLKKGVEGGADYECAIHRNK